MSHQHQHCHCCPNSSPSTQKSGWDLSRRSFLTGMAAGGSLLSGLTWSALAAEDSDADFNLMPPKRKPLVVFPILVYDCPQRKEATTWRGWGGVDCPEKAEKEIVQIQGELKGIAESADFPVEFLEIVTTSDINQLKEHPSVLASDVLLVYGAGGGVNGVQNFGKDVIIFQRWRSGEVYLQYEIVSPILLRQFTDKLAHEHLRFDDVVTDSLEELTWRLRSLCGLKNARNTRILAIGDKDVWGGQSPERREKLFTNLKNQWNMDIQAVPYDQLDTLLIDAQNDEKVIRWATQKAEEYLKIPNTTIDSQNVTMDAIVHCFILDLVFRRLMKAADCYAITISGCMVTIIPKAKTTACLTLSTLNDDGYLAFCESDFAVIPSGILLANLCGHPVFLNDPTYPHDHLVTLAHCTAPRRLDGKNLEPAHLVTHFESDYGATPKVEFKLDQTCTNILPDFLSERWAGFRGKIVDNPFKPICRSQLDVEYTVDDSVITENMPGFHWMFGYGDYMKEIAYALRRVGIVWDDLEKR